MRLLGFCCGWPEGLELSQTISGIQMYLPRDNFKRLLKTFLFPAYQCNWRIRCITTMRSTNLILLTYLLTYLLTTYRCASGCVVECRNCNREVAGLNLGLGYFAPRSTQPSIPSGSVNEYQL